MEGRLILAFELRSTIPINSLKRCKTRLATRLEV